MIHPELLKHLQMGPRWSGAIHGYSHWERVAAFGCKIAENTPGVDGLVVEYFAYLHDSQRWNDGDDDEHGPRAADSLRDLQQMIPLNTTQMAQLEFAIRNHTTLTHHSDPTIGACFDADRLDLPRVKIVVKPQYLSTHTLEFFSYN